METTKTGLVFPGQGSQYAGMGKNLINFSFTDPVFTTAKSILGIDVKRLCLEGSEEELRQTVHTQTAVFVVSYICFELLRDRGISWDMVAGHSLGEYSALIAAGVIEFKEGLALIAKRARFMQEAAEKQDGAMIAVLGITVEKVKEVLEGFREQGIVGIANYNCPGQIVVSGERYLIEKAKTELEQKGAKRVVLLPVNGAFHTSMMKDAEEKLNPYLLKSALKDAEVPLVSNTSARASSGADAIKRALARQMTSPVLWEQSIREMQKAGVTNFIEVGPGKVLSGLIKRIDRKAKVSIVEL